MAKGYPHVIGHGDKGLWRGVRSVRYFYLRAVAIIFPLTAGGYKGKSGGFLKRRIKRPWVCAGRFLIPVFIFEKGDGIFYVIKRQRLLRLKWSG
ncbi:MAG: hypothetical protein OEY01_12605 [Desulfobulbaceae bacterium]|nr:hypothetical protein [Desulfobulbaceae bacterium]HIJ79598.1 hypothetical protein [Deltaproteobacteria bacterium]